MGKDANSGRESQGWDGVKTGVLLDRWWFYDILSLDGVFPSWGLVLPAEIGRESLMHPRLAGKGKESQMHPSLAERGREDLIEAVVCDDHGLFR